MATYSRPGVFIQEVSLPQTITLADNGSAVGAFVGALSKGTTTVPVLLNSWSDFVKEFGSLEDAYPTTWAAYNFFANGGRQLYVKRMLGGSSASASVTLNDVDTDPTLTLTAANAGEWGNDLSIEIFQGGEDDRFSLIVNYGGNIVEQFNDLTMVSTDRYYALSVINSNSKYIIASDEGNVSLTPNPTVTSPTALTAGNNGADLTAGDFDTIFESFDPITNPLIFNAPDAVYFGDGDASDIATVMVGYCEDRGDCFAVVDVPSGKTVTDAKTFVTGVGSSVGQAAAYYPWILIPDSLKASPAATRLQAPGPGMVGQYLATDASRGVFKTPAGYGNRISLAVATERQLTNAELDTLNTGAAPLNAIRQVPGVGIIVMGGRTLNNNAAHRYINVRRSLIYIKKELERLSAYAVFENNDERLWASLRVTLGTFLRNYWQSGGLRGASPEQAYYVICDGTTTSSTDILNGNVNIEVGVATEYPAEFIVIKLGQITGNATA